MFKCYPIILAIMSGSCVAPILIIVERTTPHVIYTVNINIHNTHDRKENGIFFIIYCFEKITCVMLFLCKYSLSDHKNLRLAKE